MSSHYVISGTADVVMYPCPSCGQPEHGNLACGYPFAYAIDMERSVLPEQLWRVMDGEIFMVHLGSPMNEDDHCCFCAFRRKPIT